MKLTIEQLQKKLGRLLDRAFADGLALNDVLDAAVDTLNERAAPVHKREHEEFKAEVEQWLISLAVSAPRPERLQ